MNNEPLYKYVKGQGWVLDIAPSVTKRIGKYNVRFEGRKPEFGERFFSGDYQGTADYCARDRHWKHIFNQNEDSIKANIHPYDGLSCRSFVVVSWERVDD